MIIANYSFNIEFECHVLDARIFSVFKAFSKLTMAAILKYSIKRAETQVYDTSICVQSLCKSSDRLLRMCSIPGVEIHKFPS